VVNDTMTIRVCYFATCEREVQGSPFTVSTQARVTARAEPGVMPMPYLSRVALPHDVVDAEFDRVSNALVMVSRVPSNAIHVYDVATGLERSQPLSQPPMAVSLAPDGFTAAVGHDALVSIVDVAAVGQTGGPEPVLLDLTASVFDIVLDGNGFLHVFPPRPSFQPRSIEIASNTETLAGVFIRQDLRSRLHPGGQWIYSANNNSSSGNIEKIDISAGVAAALYASPYHGEYDVCGNLWFSEDGETIYTACGSTFRSSATQAQDMIRIGGMELPPSDYHGRWIRSLSESVQDDEIALIEEDRYICEIWPGEAGPCYSHFALYEPQSLAKLATYAFNLVTIDGFDYAQRGMHVFHDAMNGRKYVISRAVNSPDPLQDYFLSVVE
jgi:chitinase